VAIAISLVAGIYAGDTLDLARVSGLLPFFVLGLHATAENLERLRTHRVRTAAVLVFVALAVLTWVGLAWVGPWLCYATVYLDGTREPASCTITCLSRRGTCCSTSSPGHPSPAYAQSQRHSSAQGTHGWHCGLDCCICCSCAV
jgi:hypothetical protein